MAKSVLGTIDRIAEMCLRRGISEFEYDGKIGHIVLKFDSERCKDTVIPKKENNQEISLETAHLIKELKRELEIENDLLTDPAGYEERLSLEE